MQTAIKLAGNAALVAAWGLGLAGAAAATTAAYWAGFACVLTAIWHKQACLHHCHCCLSLQSALAGLAPCGQHLL